jgi:chromosome segregation ATPase
MGADGAHYQQKVLDALSEKNEQLVLENLRIKSAAPKLFKMVVRFSSSFRTMRGGLSTQLKQIGSALAGDFSELTAAVAAVDTAASKVRSSIEAERERLQAAVHLLEGRLLVLAAELDRKTDAHKEMQETFEEERARAEELQRDIASLKGDSAVKNDRIACLETMQSALGEQLDKANSTAEKQRVNAAELQKALSELERTNAVLASKKGTLEQEMTRARDAAAKDMAQARSAAEAASAELQNASLRLAEKEQLVAALRREVEEAAHIVKKTLEERHAQEEARVRQDEGAKVRHEEGAAALRRVAELEQQCSRQGASHKQRLEELQRHYEHQLSKVRAEREAEGRAAIEAAVERTKKQQQQQQQQAQQQLQQLKDELLRLAAHAAQVEKEGAARAMAAEKQAHDATAATEAATAGKEAALHRLAELRKTEAGLRAELQQLRQESAAAEELAATAARMQADERAAQHEHASDISPLLATMEVPLSPLFLSLSLSLYLCHADGLTDERR